MYAIEQVSYLADRKFNQLVNKLCRSVPDRADAEDIVQTAFEKAIRYAENCKEGDFDRWFNTILKNAWRDWKREDRLAGMTEELCEKNGGLLMCNKEKEELASLLRDDIAGIKNQFKKGVVYRRFCMGMAVDDIALAMEVDRERIKKCLLRWRAEVYNKYGETYE